MKKIVVVINGIGGVGKDTVCDIVSKFYSTENVSSITPIKELARVGGWNGEKTLSARRLLSDLKLAFNRYNDLSYQYIMKKYNCFVENNTAQILFVHIREPEEISRFMNSISIPRLTLLIKSGSENNPIYGNPSDDNVEDFPYDYVYENNKPLEELEQNFMDFFAGIIESVGWV